MKELLKQLAMQLKASTPTDAEVYSSLQKAGILDTNNNFTEPYKHLENMSKSQFESTLRKGIFSEIKDYCYLSKQHDYIEVTEWSNADGFDIDLCCSHGGKLSLTWGQYKLLKKLVKQLDKEYNHSLTQSSYERKAIEDIEKKRIELGITAATKTGAPF